MKMIPNLVFLQKNRYEILFFNKETLCTLLYVSNIIMPNTIIDTVKKKKLTTDGKKNHIVSNKNVITNNKKIIEKMTLIFHTLTKTESNKKEISQEEPKKMCYRLDHLTNKSKSFNINLKNEHFKDIYNILKNFCYARMYFRYSNKETFLQRFKKNENKNRKKFNYIKKYNSFSYLNIFKNFIILNLKKEYNLDDDQINKYYDKYGIENVKPLTSNDNTIIDGFLNKAVDNEEKHYENIEKVLEYIKSRTNNFIDYCIILDIKKNKIFNINSIEKKHNIYHLNKSNQRPSPSSNFQIMIQKKIENTIYVGKMTFGAIILFTCGLLATILNIITFGTLSNYNRSLVTIIMEPIQNKLRKFGIDFKHI